MLQIHEQGEPGFDETLRTLSRRGDADLERVEPAVRAILNQVRDDGDAGIRKLTEKFEHRVQEHVVLTDAQVREGAAQVSDEVRANLQTAADRIRRYHAHQRDDGFRYEEDGVQLGQRVRPVRSAAVYAPGGKARYPSTVLMTAVPAAVAGVPRIVLVTPRPTPEILAAAVIAGVTEVIDAGGAQGARRSRRRRSGRRCSASGRRCSPH